MTNRLFDCTDKQSKEALHTSEISMFTNLKDYVDEFSYFSSLGIDNFRFVFLYYFLFGLMVFAVAFGYRGLIMAAKMIRKRNKRFRHFNFNRPMISPQANRVHIKELLRDSQY